MFRQGLVAQFFQKGAVKVDAAAAKFRSEAGEGEPGRQQGLEPLYIFLASAN